MRDRRDRACVLVVAILLVGAACATAAEQPAHDWASQCAHCHLCEEPTPEHPCLKEFACPRHLGSGELSSDLGPDVTILDQLEDLYVPVYFTHGKHAQMAAMEGGCAVCHHYTPPNMPHPACRECHPENLTHEDVDQPGLKGAYHRQCLGCHVEWDQSTECEICHQKSAAGGLHGDATTFCMEPKHTPVDMSDTIIFDTEYEEGDQVPFQHSNHVHKYGGDCAFCHREQSCSQCHVDNASGHPMGDPDETDLHDVCFQCHDEEKGCEECHGRAESDHFVHASTGWPLRVYHSGVRCGSCHARLGVRFQTPSSDCRSCHPEGWDADRFEHNITGVGLDETHQELDCGDCHVNDIGHPASCDECHDDERHLERHFGSIVGTEGN